MIKRIIPSFLLLCLLLAACQAKPATTTSAQTPNIPTKGTTTPTTVPPTSAPTPKNTVENAQRIQIGMTDSQITDLLDINGQLLHPHVYVNRWEIDNGKFLYVWFYTNSDSPDASIWNYSSDWIAGGYQLTDTWKDYPGDYKPTAEDASKIHEGMSFDSLIDLLGPGGKTVGSGLVVYRWTMDDGRFLRVYLYGDVQSTQIVDEDYQTYVNANNIDKIEVGMTYEEVFHALDDCDMVVCTDAALYQYALSDGSKVLVWYRDIDNEKTVCNVEIITNTTT